MRYFLSFNIKFGIKDMILQFCRLFAYLWTGFCKIFIEKNGKLLKTTFIAIRDFVINNINYKNNKLKLAYF